MWATLFIAFFGLAAVASLLASFGASREKAPSSDFSNRTVLRFFAAVISIPAVLIAAFTTIYVVGATQVGVPVAFGHVGDPVGRGLHVKAPWASVDTYPTRPLTVDDQTVDARTAQAGQVTVVVGARWSVEAPKARELYFQVRTGDEGRISKTIVEKNLAQAVGVVYSQMDNLTAANSRQAVTDAITRELQKLTDPYGLRIDNIYVRAVTPDAKTSNSIALLTAQQRATQIAEESQNTARAQAVARDIEAKGLKQAAAELPALSPQQVQALCLNAWERMATKAIDAGIPLYSNPCSGAGTAVTVPAK